MSLGPLGGVAGSAAGSPLAQTKTSDVERAQQDTGSQQRRVQSDQKAENASGIGETDVGLAQAGDLDLAVVTPDPASVRDGFSIMKILAKERGIRRISLVANMVSSHQEGIGLYRRISSVSNRFLPLW